MFIYVGMEYEDLDLPSLKWVHNLHKCLYKQSYIAGSAKCSTKHLSNLLTSTLSRLHSYCDTSHSMCGVNQMWILKNSKYMLGYIQSRYLFLCNSIKSFDFSSLYTTLLHSKLKKNRLKELVQLSFMSKQGPYLILCKKL